MKAADSGQVEVSMGNSDCHRILSTPMNSLCVMPAFSAQVVTWPGKAVKAYQIEGGSDD